MTNRLDIEISIVEFVFVPGHLDYNKIIKNLSSCIVNPSIDTPPPDGGGREGAESSASPVLPVEAAEVNRFGKVLGEYARFFIQVGDAAGHFQDAVMGQGDLSGLRVRTPTDEPGISNKNTCGGGAIVIY